VLSRLLIYGAYGYTGELIARMAAARGARPILAGRKAARLRPLAESLGLPWRAFALDASDIDAHLAEVDVVLHCAGPFSVTARPMVEACLRQRAHYLDITGEIDVFELLAQLDTVAEERGVMVMPGVGFDVVPTDCLAARVALKVPSATHLDIAFRGLGAISHGTATTMLGKLDQGGLVRRDGRLVRVRAAHAVRSFDFGRGPVTCMTVPWGDIATAWRTTQIPNITTYMAAPRSLRLGAMLSRHLGWLLRRAAVRDFLQSRVDSAPAGPTEQQRRAGRSFVFAEARDARTGRSFASRLVAPEGYTFTALAALEIATRAHDGDAPTGFQTPAGAYGPDLVLAVEGVERFDV